MRTVPAYPVALSRALAVRPCTEFHPVPNAPDFVAGLSLFDLVTERCSRIVLTIELYDLKYVFI